MKRFWLAALDVIMATYTATATDKAADLLKDLEGFRASVYLDTAGQKTIGYGFTSAAMVGKGRLTEAEASAELDRLCRSIADRLHKELGGENILKPNEEAAVISFIFNVGWGAFQKSTMCKLLKAGKRGAIVGCEFRKWVYVTDETGKKVVSKGLANRRDSEARMFLIG